MSTAVVGRGVMGVGLPVGIDVDDRGDREGESMMQSVLDGVRSTHPDPVPPSVTIENTASAAAATSLGVPAQVPAR